MLAFTGMLALGLLAGPAAANNAKLPAGKNTDKHQTAVVIEGYIYDGGTDTVTFNGNVDCVTKCLGDREITLKNTDVKIVAGTGTTASGGTWEISFTGNDVPPGSFKAVADRKAIKKKRNGEVVKRTVCKRGVGTYEVFAPRSAKHQW